MDGFRYRIGAYEKNRNFIFGYSIKNGNGYKKNTGYTRYTDTEVPDEIIIHENFNTGSLKRIMLYNQKHQILVGKKIIETIDKDVEEDTFKVRFNWCSSQPPKVNLALSDEQALEKFGKNVKVKPKNNKNKSQLKVGDFPEFLIGKTWFSSSVYNRSRLSCNEVYRKAKNVIGYTRYESKNMYSYIRSKISSMRPMDNEAKATIEVIEIGNKKEIKFT